MTPDDPALRALVDIMRENGIGVDRAMRIATEYAAAEAAPPEDGYDDKVLSDYGFKPDGTAEAAPPSGLDVERLASVMSDAYEYVDDNGTPALPFCDDFDGFWDPFAAKVLAALRSTDTETVHEPSGIGVSNAIAGERHCTGCGEPWPCPTYEQGRAIVKAVLPSIAAAEAPPHLHNALEGGAWCAVCVNRGYDDALTLAAFRSRDTETADHASEYGRLLAERDRLIADGADPDELEMPLPPTSREGEG